MTTARTVLGDVDAGTIGVVLAHEHLIIDSPIVQTEHPHIHLPSVDEATAPYFLGQPGKVYVFLGLEPVATVACSDSPCRIEVPAQRIPKGTHRLAVNWASALGPVGIAVQLVERR